MDKTGAPGFVIAGPRRRSGTERSWCRSPARQAARRRSSKGAPPASPGTLWAFRRGSELPRVGWMGRAGKGLSGSRGRVAGGQLYLVLGTLGTVRFFVGEKSLQSEHPGYPEQGAQPTLPGGLHPSPESPGEAPLWPHWTHRTPLAAAPPAALAQLGLPGGTCGERWGCQLLTRRPCGLEGGLVTDTQGLCFLLSERMTLQPSSEGEVCPGLPRPGWEGSCCWEALGPAPLRADCERDAGAERVSI